MRDMALNLFWANRFVITMYDVQPTRWANLPRRRDDVFVPIQTPWRDRETKVSAVRDTYPKLAARWDEDTEDRDLAVQPQITAIAAVHGELVCTNDDLKTGIEQRRYTPESLEDISLRTPVSARRYRRGHRLHLHQHSAHPIHRVLGVREGGYPADNTARSIWSPRAPV